MYIVTLIQDHMLLLPNNAIQQLIIIIPSLLLLLLLLLLFVCCFALFLVCLFCFVLHQVESGHPSTAD